MVAKEPWQDKCIHRHDLVSAWCVVVIEILVVLMAFSVAGMACPADGAAASALASEWPTGGAEAPGERGGPC